MQPLGHSKHEGSSGTSGSNDSDKVGSCHLLGGIFASFIQGCLALLCIGTLIIKRQNEHPRRDWLVWFLDVMKQG